MDFVEPIRDMQQIEAMKNRLRRNADGLRDVCLFTVGVNSGLKVSTLLQLKIGDVIDPEGKVRVRVTLQGHEKGRDRSFPISITAARSIKEYLATRPGYRPEEPLFRSRKAGGHLRRGQAYKIITDAARGGVLPRQSGLTPSARLSRTGPIRPGRTSHRFKSFLAIRAQGSLWPTLALAAANWMRWT